PRHAQGLGLAEYLVVPDRLVVGMQEQVRVGLDHPRDQRRSGQIDHLGVARRVDLRARTNCFDAVTSNEHDPTLVRRSIGAVPEALGGQEFEGRWLMGLIAASLSDRECWCECKN